MMTSVQLDAFSCIYVPPTIKHYNRASEPGPGSTGDSSERAIQDLMCVWPSINLVPQLDVPDLEVGELELRLESAEQKLHLTGACTNCLLCLHLMTKYFFISRKELMFYNEISAAGGQNPCSWKLFTGIFLMRT